jgi:foldase protein PrsA
MENTQPQSFEQAKEAIDKKISTLPKLFATIDGENIESGHYSEMLLSTLKPDQIPSFISASEEDIKNHAKQFVQNEINNRLMHLCAASDGYPGSSEEVIKDFDQWYETIPPQEKAKFDEHLVKQSLSLADFRKETAENIPQQQRLATDRWIKEKAVVEVSKEEIEAAYESGKEQNCSEPDQVKVAHIPFRHDKSEEKRIESKNKAEEVLEKIKKGADFDAMIKENPSSEGYLKRLGILDFFKPGTYNENFEIIAFGLKVGEVSELVDTEDGFEIIKCLDKKQGQITPLEKVEKEIKKSLINEKTSGKILELINAKRDDYSITLHV